MRHKIFIIGIILIGLVSTVFPQQTFRKAVLLRRSVGGHIWQHEGATTSVPTEVTAYNAAHNYTEANAFTFTNVYPFPVVADNEWYNWYKVFHNQTAEDHIYTDYIEGTTYNVIVIKTCFFSSDMYGVGQPSDTTNLSNRTIYNYKYIWRDIIRIMESYPNNFFVIWTGAPNVEAETSQNSALWSHQFYTWAKDTLAAGLDATYGAFPPNVYVFDYFHKLVNENYYERPEYADALNDAHPNAAASNLVAPQLVQEVFSAAIVYESGITINCKVQLEGPYAGTGIMTTTLNTNSLIHLNSNTAYPTSTYGYTASTVTSIPNSEIVDWVLVELRTGTAAGTKVATRAGFLKSDGTIVDTNGTSPLQFAGLGDGNYYVVVRHRNHLAIMSASAIPLSNSSALYDFSTAQLQAYGTNPMADFLGNGTVFGMWMGDVNSDGVVKYNLTDNDRLLIYNRIENAGVNITVSGYYNEDVNMDGVVKYNLSNNDRLLIYNVIGNSGVNLTKTTQVPN